MPFRPLAVFLLLFAPAAVLAQPTTRPMLSEVRGTWMTTTANDALASPQQTAESMKRLAEMGFNTVYVECWKNGYTEFPSQVMADLVGVPLKVNDAPAELQRDLLLEASVEARRNGLICIAWFEYGFMAAYKETNNELRQLGLKQGWLTTTAEGEIVGEQNPFVWLNPLHPKAQELLLAIVLEAVDNYDLDGVQLDDRIAMPVEMGYDPYTKKLYAADHEGRMPPESRESPHWDEWVQWRADKISQYAREFARRVKEARPGLVVSVSPAPYPWSLENYCCDWPKWSRWEDKDGGGPLWDEFVPQCYRLNYEAFADNWREQVAAMNELGGGRTEDLIAGIRVVGDGPDTPWADVAKKMNLARELGGGYCIWFSRAVLEVYPEQFAAYHERLGPARNPHFPENWRPRPMPLTVKAHAATAEDIPPGRYRVVFRRNGILRQTNVIEHDGGAFETPLPTDTTDATLFIDRTRDLAER